MEKIRLKIFKIIDHTKIRWTPKKSRTLKIRTYKWHGKVYVLKLRYLSRSKQDQEWRIRIISRVRRVCEKNNTSNEIVAIKIILKNNKKQSWKSCVKQTLDATTKLWDNISMMKDKEIKFNLTSHNEWLLIIWSLTIL